MRTIDIAYSPCPNDTFIFSGWVNNEVPTPLQVLPHLYDVQQLNAFAYNATFPVTKLSVFCFGKVLDRYALLPVGAAIGYDCGPKIISKKEFDIKDIPSLKIAFPGKDTTAFLLFVTLFGMPKEPHFYTYDEILNVVEKEQVDIGVIIHETRFTFSALGYKEVCDLGTLFYEKFKCPTPLGVFAIRRDISESEKFQIVAQMKTSLRYAYESPEKAMEYVLLHSREKERKVVQKHIDLYVTHETMDISESGKEAILRLFETAVKLHLLPENAMKAKL